jgi:hypothetical protein
MDEVTVSFSVGTYRMIEQIGKVKREASLFSGTGPRCEGAFCTYGAVAIKNSIVDGRRRHALDSRSFSHGGPR